MKTYTYMNNMPRIFVENLTKEEKKKLDIAKAKSDAKTWKEFFIELMEDEGRENSSL